MQVINAVETPSTEANDSSTQQNIEGGDAQPGKGDAIALATDKPKEEAPKKYKFKVAGKESEATPEELIRRLQNTEGYAAKAKEILAAAKALEEQQSRYADPDKALELLLEMHGDKAEKLFAQRLQAKYEQEQQMAQMTPEMRQLYEAYQQQNGKLSQYEKQQQELQAQQEAAYEAQAVEQLREELGDITLKTLKAMELPDSLRGKAMKWLLPELQAHIEAGIAPNPEVLSKAYQAEIMDVTKSTIEALPDSAIARMFPGLGKRLAMHYLNEAKGGKLQTQIPVEQPTSHFAKPTSTRANGYEDRWKTIKTLK